MLLSRQLSNLLFAKSMLIYSRIRLTVYPVDWSKIMVSPYDIEVEKRGYLVRFLYDGEVLAFGELRHELSEESIQEGIQCKREELAMQLSLIQAFQELLGEDESGEQDGEYPYDMTPNQ